MREILQTGMTTSLGFLQHNLWDTAKINQVSPGKFTTSSPTYVLRLLTNCSLIPIQGWVSEYKSLAFVSTCPIKEGDCTSDNPNIAFRARDCNNAVTKQYKGAKGFTAMTFGEENSKFMAWLFNIQADRNSKAGPSCKLLSLFRSRSFIPHMLPLVVIRWSS